jgi:hypothetical protein
MPASSDLREDLPQFLPLMTDYAGNGYQCPVRVTPGGIAAKVRSISPKTSSVDSTHRRRYSSPRSAVAVRVASPQVPLRVIQWTATHFARGIAPCG